ncbi:MAG: type II toxin-antitoxin system RelE/ParE family toxin [Hydrogenophilales bacterium]|nr:type II toxin-antitoxin system RelE/ParE family toxin [Hydrogenophilales bacterium]
MKLVWTEPAVNDLRGIHEYIGQDSRFYAEQFVERLILAAEKLADFPGLGRMVPEAGTESIREPLFQAYRIIYRLEPERVSILAVIHGSRDLVGRASKPWDVT